MCSQPVRLKFAVCESILHFIIKIRLSPLAHLIYFLAFSYTASFRLTIMAESKLDYSEPDYVKQQDKSKVPYYRPDLTDRISPEVSFDLCPHDQMSSDMST